MRLRTLLPLLFLLFFVVTASTAFLTIRHSVLTQVENEQLEATHLTLNSLQMNLERFLKLKDSVGVTNLVSSYAARPGVYQVFVTNPQGSVIASTNYVEVGHDWQTIDSRAIASEVDDVLATKVNQVHLHSESGFLEGYASVCGPQNKQSLRAEKCGFLFYAMNTTYLKQRAIAALVDYVSMAGMGFLFGAILFYLIIHLRVSQPVDKLLETLRAFAKGNHLARVKIYGEDEMAQIAKSINQLFDQLNQERSDLISSEQRQNAIINSTKYSIISTDTDGIILSFNRAAEQMLGYRAEEMIGKQTPAIIHKFTEVEAEAQRLSIENNEVVPIGFDVFVYYAKKGQVFDKEWSYVRKDGSEFPVKLSVTAIYDAQGNIGAYLGIAEDLSEQKKIEQLKNDFVSTVSHELRTPLTSIKGSLGLAKSGMLGVLPEKLKSMLDIAYSNSERLILLINDILDIEKITSGKMVFNKAPLDVIDLVNQSLQANEAYADNFQVSLARQFDAESVYVHADFSRLMQVMANLLSNAIKFSHKGGTVVVKVSDAPESQGSEAGVCIQVIDEGSGIPEDYQPKVFERFTQADSSVTRQKGGTGLGLSITKGIVEKHGGNITFVSNAKGTVFTVTLPKYQEPMA